jgi:predicted O-methyltransferase YrrM
MHFISEDLGQFVCDNSQKEPELLDELNCRTNTEILRPRMLSGHFQGRALSMLSHMIQPKNVLDIGTYTGYSALCFAEGMQKDGKLITIDINEELEYFSKSFFEKSDYKGMIETRVGNALEIIPTLDLKFDIVFIDADKSNYINYYNAVIDKMNPGGYIIADNVLWSGKVVEDYDSLDIDTKVLVDYCKMTTEDDRVQNVLFPIRDGLMISRVK